MSNLALHPVAPEGTYSWHPVMDTEVEETSMQRLVSPIPFTEEARYLLHQAVPMKETAVQST